MSVRPPGVAGHRTLPTGHAARQRWRVVSSEGLARATRRVGPTSAPMNLICWWWRRGLCQPPPVWCVTGLRFLLYVICARLMGP